MPQSHYSYDVPARPDRKATRTEKGSKSQRRAAVRRLYRNTTAKDRKAWAREGISFEEMLEWANYDSVPGHQDREFGLDPDTDPEMDTKMEQARQQSDRTAEALAALDEVEDDLNRALGMPCDK